MPMGIELRAYRELQQNGYNNDEIRDYFAENNLDLDVAGEEIEGNPRRKSRLKEQLQSVGEEMNRNAPNEGLLGIDRNSEAFRGVRDMGGGVVQAGLAATDAMGITDGEQQKFTDWENQNIESYEAQRKAEGEEGYDWSRLGGQMAASGGAGGGKILAGKMLQGAGVGAATGAGMFAPQGFGSTENLAQTLGGGVGGAGGALLGNYAQPVVRAGMQQFGKLMQSIGRKVSPAKADDIGRVLADSLNRQGINIGEIPEAHAKMIREEVEAAMKVGDDPAAAVRSVVLREMGFVDDAAPTRAQLSDNGALWTREQEASKAIPYGEQIADRYTNQLTRFDEITDDMSKGIGGHSVDDIAATNSAFDNILDQWHTSQKAVSGKYKAARTDAKGAETTLDSFKAKVEELYDLGLDETIPQVKQAWSQMKRNGLDETGNVLAPVNANRIEEMKIALQSGWKNLDGKQKMIVRDLTESLMDDADKMGNPFKQARKAAQDRFVKYDNPLVNDITSGKSNETNFVSTKILGGKPKDIAELKINLMAGKAEGKQAWNNIKGRVFDHFMKKSYQGNRSSTTSQFSGKRLGAALDGKDTVLAEIFDPDEVKMLKKLVTSGEWLFSPRRQSNVNTSNTASAFTNAVNSGVSHLPGAQMLKRGVQGAVDEFTAGQALSGMPPMMSPTPVADAGGNVAEHLLRKAGVPVVPNILTEEQP